MAIKSNQNNLGVKCTYYILKSKKINIYASTPSLQCNLHIQLQSNLNSIENIKNNMNSFSQKYTVVEVISSKATKKTSIVKDSVGKYYISKKLFINDEEALKQIELIKNIKHPNIVSFHEMVVEKSHIYLIQEFCEEGDIGFHIRRQIRKKKTYFSQELIAQWLLQILLALQYLQNQKIMHRDIRPQNIFLTSKGHIKLGSFRSSKIFQGQTDLAVTVLGSPYYMAPEFVQKQSYDYKVDIWALGCVLFQLCALRPIYNTKNMVELAHKIMKGKIQELPSSYSKQLNIILNRCLKKKPLERPSARQLLRTNYFLQVMQKFVIKKGLIIAQNRIPIKRYKIHNKVLQNAKIKRGINRCPSRQKKEQKVCFDFPRLQIQTTKNARKSICSRSKQYEPKTPCCDIMKIKVYRSVEKMKKNSEQKIFNQSKQKKAQYVIKKRPPINKALQVENGIKYSPNLKKKQEKSRQNLKKSRQKQVRTPKQETKESPKEIKSVEEIKQIKEQKKKMLPPPMLPRPVYKNPQKKIDLSNTMKKKDLQEQLSQFRSKQPQKQQSQKNDETSSIKENLAKLFEDLNIRQDDEEEFSFDLEDQNMARLTFQENQNTEFLKTYKTKLQQMIQEINYKYCPSMEPIQERTSQFDSNTFAQFHA